MMRPLALLVLLGCAAEAPVQPQVPPTASVRLQMALDSVNAAIRDLYQEGRRMDFQVLQPDSYPPDPTIPPVIVVLYR